MATNIDYPAIVRGLLRGVMPKVLVRVAEEGLPGDHHLFIAFDTSHPSVVMPNHLRAGYPDQMTIVIQHQYENLHADDEGFGIRLRFGGRPADLWVPYGAVLTFADPSVEFGLSFEAEEAPPKLAAARPERAAEAERPDAPDDADGDEREGGTVVQVDFSKKR